MARDRWAVILSAGLHSRIQPAVPVKTRPNFLDILPLCRLVQRDSKTAIINHAKSSGVIRDLQDALGTLVADRCTKCIKKHPISPSACLWPSELRALLVPAEPQSLKALASTRVCW